MPYNIDTHPVSTLAVNKSWQHYLSEPLVSPTVFLVLLILFISACSTQQPKIEPATIQTEIKQKPGGIIPQEPVKIDDQLYIAGISALQQNDLSKAQQLFSEFINKNPKLSGAYVNLALINFKQGKFEQSAKLTNKALEINASQAQAYQLRAQLSIKNGNINDAKKDYLKAIEINPDYINAQYNLALLYDIYLQEIDLAIKHYEIYMTLINKPDEPTQEWINHLKSTLKNG